MLGWGWAGLGWAGLMFSIVACFGKRVSESGRHVRTFLDIANCVVGPREVEWDKPSGT